MFASMAAGAQNINITSGTVPQFSGFGLSRMHQFSTLDLNLSTARSAAMGGAFTSLGADLSSMHINPAGLGMYQSSEMAITFGPSIGKFSNSMRGENSVSNNRTQVALNNFGAALNLFEGSGTTTSFTFGVGYSRLADYNYRSTMNVAGGGYSILDLFDWQVADGSTFDYQTIDSWGSSLAWDTALLRDQNGDLPDDPTVAYWASTLGDNTSTYKRINTLSKGSAGEYSFAAGWNFRNTFYFGFSLNFVDIYQLRETTYSEDYANNTGVADPASYMDFSQRVKTTGEGYNLKLGFVARPTPELRIGAAFHTPTIMTTHDFAQYEMFAGYVNDGAELSSLSEGEEYENQFYTPARVLAGVSYTFGGRGVVALDYEAAFYSGMGVRGDRLYSVDQRDEFRDMVKEHFTTANTVRLGAEFMATDMLMLRGGYSYTDGGVRSNMRSSLDNRLLDLPVRYESQSLSLGLGVRIGDNTQLDLTYAFQDAKYTDSDMFRYSFADTGYDPTADIFPGADTLDLTRTKEQRHHVMLSLGFRF